MAISECALVEIAVWPTFQTLLVVIRPNVVLHETCACTPALATKSYAQSAQTLLKREARLESLGLVELVRRKMADRGQASQLPSLLSGDRYSIGPGKISAASLSFATRVFSLATECCNGALVVGG